MAAGLLIFVLPLFLLLVVGAVVVLVVLAATHRPDATLTHEVATARRHGLTVSVVATVVLLLGTVVLGLGLARTLPSTAVVVAAAPLLAGCAALGVLLVGELTWPRPRGATRTAVLSARRVRDLATGGWALTAAIVTTALALGVLVAAALAGPTGRTVVHTSGDHTSAAGPFPGLVYGGPQLVALALAVLLTLAVLRAATRRAAVVTADAETDGLLRRSSAGRAFRVLTFVVVVTLAADLFFAGAAAQRAFDGPASVVAGVVTVTGLLCGLLSPAALLVPVPRLTRAAVPPHPVHT